MIKKCSRNKTEKVNDVDVDGLADTASDYTVIREDVIETKNIPCEKNYCSDSVKGVGGLANFKGKFLAKIDIDNELHNVDCFIMSKEDIDDELIIGWDIIGNCHIELTPKKFTLKKIFDTPKANCDFKIEKPSKKKAFTLNELDTIENHELSEKIQSFGRINCIAAMEMVDLTNIANKVHRDKLEMMIREYKLRPEIKCPIEMEIFLTDETPVVSKPKRMSPDEKAEINRQVEQWLKDDVIVTSFSDFASNIVIVPKKDNTKRMCIDYRPLNKKIIRDRFSIPNLEDQLDQLQTGLVFTSIDLKNGYFHVPVKEIIASIQRLSHQPVSMNSNEYLSAFLPVQRSFAALSMSCFNR